MRWQLEQLQATTPSRIGRDGLGTSPRRRHSPCPARGEASALCPTSPGRRVLLVFTQSGCGPCSEIIPELNRLHEKGEFQVVIVNNGEPGESARWAERCRNSFSGAGPGAVQPVQERYEAFATPFAFLIDEAELIVSKGIVGTRQHLGYVLTGGRSEGEAQGVAIGWGRSREGRIGGVFLDKGGGPCLRRSET